MPNETQDQVLVGAGPMAAELKPLTVRQVRYMLQSGRIKSARKVGDQYMTSRSALRAEFGLAGTVEAA
jgi:hypothetical protein